MKVHTTNSVYEVKAILGGYRLEKVEDTSLYGKYGFAVGWSYIGKTLELEIGKPMVLVKDENDKLVTSPVLAIEQ